MRLKVYCSDLRSSPEEPNGETAGWGHYFDDFIGGFVIIILLTALKNY